jgi:chemotaxis response regulator CheB
MKVYVVEDSDAICQRIVQMVNDVKGSSVIGTASTVTGAIRGIKKCLPEVVILDIQGFAAGKERAARHQSDCAHQL